jgi:hypothetical protein
VEEGREPFTGTAMEFLEALREPGGGMSMPGQFPISDLFESGECAGCGVLLDDAGIVMVEPSDPRVRLACGPWAQESCGECTLPLPYWRLAAPLDT